MVNDQALTPAKRVIRKRGKVQTIAESNKPRLATGDSIRGQLHLDTFYGAIKLSMKDENGNILRNSNGEIITEEKLKYVLRVPFQYKSKADGVGFKTVEEIEKQIVDKALFQQIRIQVESAGGLKEAFENGIFMLDKKGNQVNKIRHLRCWASVSEPLKIKQQTYLSKHDHKNHYWAANGENIICAYYKKDKIDKKGNVKKVRELEIINLFDAAKLKSFGLITKRGELEVYKKKDGEIITDEDGRKERPYVFLKAGLKVVFYENSLTDLKLQSEESMEEFSNRISNRMYKIVKFAGGQVTFQHHLDSRDEKQHMEEYSEDKYFKTDSNGKELTYGKRGKNGFTEKISDYINYNEGKPWHKLLYTKDWLDFAIEGKDFIVNIDGTIAWIN